jgi:urease accessory protein
MTTSTCIGRDAAPPQGLTLLRLLQLASPALPIGAFAYSQGLEPAVTAGLVTDEKSASRWILGLLRAPFARSDLAIFARLHAAFAGDDLVAAERWNAYLLASRASLELQAEDLHLGAALARVLATLGIVDPALDADDEAGRDRRPTGATSGELGGPPDGATGPGAGGTAARCFARMFALASARWGIEVAPAAQAFAFSWAEAQTSAAVRLVPLGQSAGVRILAEVGGAIPDAVEMALALPDDELGGAAPQHALLSMAHETQYSRLFRS